MKEDTNEISYVEAACACLHLLIEFMDEYGQDVEKEDSCEMKSHKQLKSETKVRHKFIDKVTKTIEKTVNKTLLKYSDLDFTCEIKIEGYTRKLCYITGDDRVINISIQPKGNIEAWFSSPAGRTEKLTILNYMDVKHSVKKALKMIRVYMSWFSIEFCGDHWDDFIDEMNKYTGSGKRFSDNLVP